MRGRPLAQRKGRVIVETTDRHTAVGVFPDLTHAEHAVGELCAAGFSSDQIGCLTPDAAAKTETPLGRGTMVGEGASVGAVAGVTAGVLLGVVLSNFVLPGVGPVLVGGLLAGALGAAAGAAGGGVLGALIGMNIPEEEARLYEQHFHSGRTLVTVRADGRYEEAVALLRQAEEWEPEHHVVRGRLAGLEEETGESEGGGSAFVPRP